MVALALGALGVAACAPKQSRWSRTDVFKTRTSPQAYELYLRGRKASFEGRHREAVAYFRQAAAFEPDDVTLRIAIAEEQLSDGQLAEATAEVKLILQRWPEEPDGWILRGRIANANGERKGAVLAYEQAIALEPDDERAYLLAALTYEKLDDGAKAQDALVRLLKRWPESIEGHYRLGRAFLRAGKLADAEKHLVRAVQLEPDHVDARVALADVYRKTGRPQLASQTLRDAFDRSGEDPAVGEELFRVLLETGDRDAAVELLAMLDADWRDPESRLLFGYLYLQVHRPDEAIKIADALLTRSDTNHAARILKARALVQKRQRTDAIAVCLEVPPTAAEYPEARALAGDLHARLGTVKEGLALVDEALKVYPESVPLLISHAALVEKGGDVAAARAELAAVAKRRPEDQDVVFARASLEDRNGKHDEAIAIMQELLDDEPDSVMALNFIGYSLATRGVELTRAQKLLERAVSLRPDDGYVLDSYGWLLYQQEKLDEATSVLEQADRLAPDEPEILYHLGETYARRGEGTKAKELFNRALNLDPDDRTRVRLEERVKTAEKR